jgi:hypothetical protein
MARGARSGRTVLAKVLVMWRKAILATVSLASLLLTVACGGSHPRTLTHMGLPAATTAQQACIDNVSALLLESYHEMRNGHYSDIPADSVLETYGYLSPTYRSYFELNSTLIGYVAAYGILESPVPAVLAATKVDGGVHTVCLGYVQQAAQSFEPVQPTVQAGLSPATSITYPTPTSEARGPAGCPGSADLIAAWNAAPAEAFHAQAISHDMHLSGFDGITCWRG